VGGAPSLSGDILIRSAVDGEVSPMMDMLGADILIVAWPTQSTVSGRPSFPLLPRHWAAAAAVISAAGPARIRQGRCLPQLGAGVCVCVSVCHTPVCSVDVTYLLFVHIAGDVDACELELGVQPCPNRHKFLG